MNPESLFQTIQKHVFCSPVILHDYVRKFESNCWQRSTLTNTPVSALNIKPCTGELVNGVVFEVDEEGMKKLRLRESGYSVIDVEVHGYMDHQKLSAITFLDESSETFTFATNDPNQHQYLSICIQGASRFGEGFEELFKQHTFIETIDLSEYLITHKNFSF